MKYKFNVGRAVKLNTETGINILDGDLEASQLTYEYNMQLKKCLGIRDDSKLSEDVKLEMLVRENGKLDSIRNARDFATWKYAMDLIPYFCTSNDYDLDEITIDEIDEFYNEINNIFNSAFKGSKGDMGKS